jgi:hypothetical protein
MRKVTILAVIALAFVLAPAAFAADAGSGSSLGIVFNLNSVLLSIGDYSDGVQAGGGIKWWIKDDLALRALLGFNITSDLTQQPPATTSRLGLSAGAEWHPRARAKVSPYLGGFAGIQAMMPANTIDFYIGGMGGVELTVWENVGVFGEYDLLAAWTAAGFTIGIGAGSSAKLGLAIYF